MKPITINSPRYVIRRKKEEFFDTFYTHEKAIEETIKLALQFPGNKFETVKQINHKETVIFYLCIDMKYDISLTQKVLNKFISIFTKQANSIQYWRL